MDNDLAFDITRCAIDAVSKIPCENMLTNENVSDPPPAIPETGIPIDCPPDGGGACPEIEPAAVFRTANLVVTSQPGFALRYRFIKGANCTFDLEIEANISDIIFGSGGGRPGGGSSASFSDSSSCVDLWPSDFPHTVALTPIEGGEDEPPTITYQFIRDPDRCAYALEISGTYRDGITEEKTIFTDLYCEDGRVYGVTETLTFEHGILVAAEPHDPAIVDCSPCCLEHESPCSPEAGIPSILHVTLNHAGFTINFDIVWSASGNCSGGAEGWGYNHALAADFDIEICPGLSFRALTLCCVPNVPRWDIELVLVFGAIQQDFQTSLAHPAVIESPPPSLLLTWDTEEISTDCGFDDVTIAISA